LPVVVAEAALGQYRRRNVVDAYGPGAGRILGGLLVVGAVVAAALLAVLAGWSGRLFLGSFEGSWFDDPGRHVRLLTEGGDALLGLALVVLVATVVALRGTRDGLRGTVVASTTVASLLLAGAALWVVFQDGVRTGLRELVVWDGGIDPSVAVAAALAGLLPALLATALASTMSSGLASRTLPREAFLGLLFTLLALAAAVVLLSATAAAHGVVFSGDGIVGTLTSIASLFALVGGAEGGFLLGAFCLAVLLASLVALVALLEVPATWLQESLPGWSEGRSLAASGLAVYLVGVPLCFSVAAVDHVSTALAWVVAPLAALLVSLHVGWVRPKVLDGFEVGEEGHRLDRGLVPILRFALPVVFLALLVLGLLGFVRSVGWTDGSAGLWSLAP
jgi:hypothetical protein